MRFFEILLVVANFCTVVVFAVPRLRAIHWAGYVVLITLALVVVQSLVEGSRWQMVPAYVLAGLFLVVWVVQRVAPAGGSIKQILTRRVVAGCAIIMCLLGMGLSAALPVVLPVFLFPSPSGPYQIGTLTYHLLPFMLLLPAFNREKSCDTPILPMVASTYGLGLFACEQRTVTKIKVSNGFTGLLIGTSQMQDALKGKDTNETCITNGRTASPQWKTDDQCGHGGVGT